MESILWWDNYIPTNLYITYVDLNPTKEIKSKTSHNKALWSRL